MNRQNEALPVNKLILLYFIEKTGMAVSNSQITQFMLLHSYTDYFNLQESIYELICANYVMKKNQNKKTLYYITDEGAQTLGFFHSIIPDSAKKNVTDYLHENGKKIQAEQDVSANYFPTKKGEYLVKCALIEGSGDMLMELSLITANKEHARQICSNWRDHTAIYYKGIMEMLSRKS